MKMNDELMMSMNMRRKTMVKMITSSEEELDDESRYRGL